MITTWLIALSAKGAERPTLTLETAGGQIFGQTCLDGLQSFDIHGDGLPDDSRTLQAGKTTQPSDGKFERHFVGPYYMSGMWGVDDDQPEYAPWRAVSLDMSADEYRTALHQRAKAGLNRIGE